MPGKNRRERGYLDFTAHSLYHYIKDARSGVNAFRAGIEKEEEDIKRNQACVEYFKLKTPEEKEAFTKNIDEETREFIEGYIQNGINADSISKFISAKKRERGKVSRLLDKIDERLNTLEAGYSQGREFDKGELYLVFRDLSELGADLKATKHSHLVDELEMPAMDVADDLGFIGEIFGDYYANLEQDKKYRLNDLDVKRRCNDFIIDNDADTADLEAIEKIQKEQAETAAGNASVKWMADVCASRIKDIDDIAEDKKKEATELFKAIGSAAEDFGGGFDGENIENIENSVKLLKKRYADIFSKDTVISALTEGISARMPAYRDALSKGMNLADLERRASADNKLYSEIIYYTEGRKLQAEQEKDFFDGNPVMEDLGADSDLRKELYENPENKEILEKKLANGESLDDDDFADLRQDVAFNLPDANIIWENKIEKANEKLIDETIISDLKKDLADLKATNTWNTKQSRQFKAFTQGLNYLIEKASKQAPNPGSVAKAVCAMEIFKVNYINHCIRHPKNNSTRKNREELISRTMANIKRIKSLPEINEKCGKIYKAGNMKDALKVNVKDGFEAVEDAIQKNKYLNGLRF